MSDQPKGDQPVPEPPRDIDGMTEKGERIDPVDAWPRPEPEPELPAAPEPQPEPELPATPEPESPAAPEPQPEQDASPTDTGSDNG